MRLPIREKQQRDNSFFAPQLTIFLLTNFLTYSCTPLPTRITIVSLSRDLNSRLPRIGKHSLSGVKGGTAPTSFDVQRSFSLKSITIGKCSGAIYCLNQPKFFCFPFKIFLQLRPCAVHTSSCILLALNNTRNVSKLPLLISFD